MKTHSLFFNWFVIILATLFLSIYGTECLSAGVICVSNTGNDENTGIPGSPYQNIQTALDSASAGDTIKVSAGTYSEELITITNVIILGGYTESFSENDCDIFMNKTIISGVSPIMYNDDQGSTINGFIFTGNSNVTDAAIKVYNNSVVSHNIVQGINKTTGENSIEIYGGALVINNIFDGGWYALQINSGTGTPNVRNNIITGSSFGLSTAGYDASIRTYNNVFGNIFDYTGFDDNPGTGDISEDPMFKDELNNDFRILESSSCVDAGDPLDSAGEEPAPYNLRIDIGAYGGTNHSPYLPLIPEPPTLKIPNNNLAELPADITLKWNQIKDIDNYRLQVATNISFSSGIICDSTSISDTLFLLTDLSYNTTYYWRVNATVTLGTSEWSEIWQFSTYENEPTCGDSIYDDRDGCKYPTVQIGNKCWMCMNLEYHNIDTFNYNNEICPEYWHLPTIYEWLMLNDIYSAEDLLPEGKSGLSINYGEEFWTSYEENGPSCYYNDQGAQVCCYNIYGFLTSCYTNRKYAFLDKVTDSINIINEKIFRSGFEFDFSDIFYKARCVCDSAYFAAPFLVYPNDDEDSQPTTLLLQWNSVKDAETYHLQVSKFDNFSTLIFNDSTIIDTTKQIEDLNNLTSYYWRVRAKNAVVISSWSEVWSFTTSNSVQVNELYYDIRYKLYPNPAFNELYIEGAKEEIMNISIFSIDGKLLKQIHSKGIKQIDISDLQNGIYIIELVNPKIMVIKKIVKQ